MKRWISTLLALGLLCEYDGWLYVCIPRGELAWRMDVDGQYGFVKAADVRTAASFVQLDWQKN